MGGARGSSAPPLISLGGRSFLGWALLAHNLAELGLILAPDSRVYQLMDLSNLYLLTYYDIIVFISTLALRFTCLNISSIFFTFTYFILPKISNYNEK